VVLADIEFRSECLPRPLAFRNELQHAHLNAVPAPYCQITVNFSHDRAARRGEFSSR